MRGAECEPVDIFFRSVPQMPQVCTRTRSSPGPICGTGTDSTRTSFLPWYTAACMVAGILCTSLRVAFAVTGINVKPRSFVKQLHVLSSFQSAASGAHKEHARHAG